MASATPTTPSATTSRLAAIGNAPLTSSPASAATCAATIGPTAPTSVPAWPISALDPAPGASRRLSGVAKKFLLAGEFGAAARLSAKALRLYAEQGLLLPARVDPVTG